MERKKINILIFSPSARKVWVQPLKKVLNPSYWLLAYLAARLSDIYNVFTITKSFDPVSKVKQYNDEKIAKPAKKSESKTAVKDLVPYAI